MNFDFLGECRMESDQQQNLYGEIQADLAEAESLYWKNPRECGVIVRGVAEKVCRLYNLYYEIGCPAEASLEEFLCYTDEDAHNAMVSRFLSAVRREQRDRLNHLRVWGDDCILGREAPDQGMTFENRMSLNAKHMMETVMEVCKEMCGQINRRDDVRDRYFQEEGLPGYEERMLAKEEEERKKRRSLLGRIFGNAR